jgi:hypothetical protein
MSKIGRVEGSTLTTNRSDEQDNPGSGQGDHNMGLVSQPLG